MPLISGTWKANVNGRPMDLEVGQPEPGGAVGVQLVGFQIGNANRGIWDEGAQRLVFGVAGAPLDSPFSGFFESYLFRTPVTPEPGQDIVWTLAGTFTVMFPSVGDPSHPALASSRRSTFGWYATKTEVV